MKRSPNYKMCPKTFKQNLKQGINLRIDKFFKEAQSMDARTPDQWMKEYFAWCRREMMRKYQDETYGKR